jgi:predicted HicB family RNase H-like nuclease
MAISKAQQKAVAKYMKNNYDELKIRVPKGEKEQIKAHADNQGESLNGFVKRAIDETMKRDNETTTE